MSFAENKMNTIIGMILYRSLPFLLMAWVSLHAEKENLLSTPLLRVNDVPGWTIVETRHFTGKELYGYIDGGAELYLEYGFEELTVQQLQQGEQELLVEIYRMKDAEAAFGIFSVSHQKCYFIENFTRYHCDSPYQLLFVKGVYFVVITNYQGIEPAREKALAAARKISDKIKQPDVNIPVIFRSGDFRHYLNQLKFCRGVLGIQNAIPEWQKLFDGFKGFSFYVLKIEPGDRWADIGLISFPSPAELRKFVDRLHFPQTPGTESKWLKNLQNNHRRAIKIKDENRLMFVEWSSGYSNFEQLLQQLSR